MILTWLLLIILANCETDISNNNCPETFNITEANVTTGIGFSELSLFYFSPFSTPQRTAQVQEIIISSDYQKMSSLIMGEYIIPYIVIATVFAITFFIVILCIVFEKSCPPCHSWRRDFAKRPYQKFEIRCVGVFAVVFSVGILVTAIISFTIVPSLHIELENTKCGMYNSLDIALNGDGQQWGGFSHIKNQVGNISKLLPTANSQVNLYFNDDETLPDMMDKMRQDNLDLYSLNKDSQVISPDPIATNNAILASDPLPRIKSNFIQTKFGPNGTEGTMTTDIDVALQSTENLSNQADEIITSAFILVESSSTIEANTANSQEILTMYENQLNTYKANLDTFSTNYFDPVFNWGIYVVEVVLGFILVASLAVVIGAVSVQFLDIADCRYFLHFGWIVYGFTYFGLILVAFFTLPMASMGYTFCQYYNQSLSNETSYKRIGDYYSQNVLSKLDVCLFGDGNVLEKFQIADEMDTVARLFLNIDLFNEYENSTNAKYIDQSISQTMLSNWKSTLESYRDGITKDVDQSVLSDQNPMLSLANLNKYSLWTTQNAGDTVKRCSRDRWVYNGNDCTDSEFKYVTPSTQTEGKTISMDYDSCIALDTMLYSSAAGIWSLTDFTDRYKQIKHSSRCPTAYNFIIDYAQSITNYRDSRTKLFQSLIDEIVNLQTSHNTFDAQLNTFRGQLASFSSTTTIRNLNNFVTNQIDGLLVSSQCEPIGDRMKYLHNSFCVDAMGMTVELGICVLVLMALMIGGVFTSCIFAQRVSTVKRLHKIHEDAIFALPDQSIHSQIQRDNKLQKFQRKQRDSSDSSSSSQED